MKRWTGDGPFFMHRYIWRYAKATGKDIKRTHKIRKTFASVLNANGVPIDTIRECLGHTNLQTTMAYLFDPLTNEETYERLSSAF